MEFDDMVPSPEAANSPYLPLAPELGPRDGRFERSLRVTSSSTVGTQQCGEFPQGAHP